MSLESLIARVTAAEGPDRELDAATWKACGARLKLDDWWLGHKYLGRQLPAVTASLDAALALVEAALPGSAVLILGIALRDFQVSRNWRDLPMRVVLALLRALEPSA